MAADVTTFIRMNDYDDQKQRTRESVGGGEGTSSNLITRTRESVGGGDGASSNLITRDLLGGCSTLESEELDLDLQVPSGWEKRLDLKSGKVYIQRCISPKQEDTPNIHPQSKKPLHLLDDTTLKLRLSPSSPSPSSRSSSSSCYQSVCTLDKVKSALERARNESNYKKRSKSSSSHSNSSSSIKETGMEVEDEVEVEKKPISCPSFAAAGCPGCLLYVLVSKNNPHCPRCHTTVPLPQSEKRPRIDLNISI